MSTASARPADAGAVRRALRIYRVMAVVAGLALFVLIAAMVAKYGFGQPRFSALWSPIHGFIYMGYAASIAHLGFMTRWSLWRMVKNLLTGFVPLLPFVAERRVTADTEALLSRAHEVGDAPSGGTGAAAAGESSG